MGGGMDGRTDGRTYGHTDSPGSTGLCLLRLPPEPLLKKGEKTHPASCLQASQ